MDSFLETILAEDTFCSCKALYLRLDHELARVVGSKLSPNDECLLGSEGDSAFWDGDHVFLHQLCSLVLVKHQLSLGQRDQATAHL